jgi:putative membrane protein
MRWIKTRRENPWVGMAAGMVGGLAGSVAIGQFLHLWDKLTGSHVEEEGTRSTTEAASAVSEKVLDHPLTEEEKPKAAAAVHFGFGTSVAALYGAAAAMEPRFADAYGVPFGASVYLGAHATAVPALGLSKPVTQKPVKAEAGEFLGHLIYGVVTELTRRGVIAAVRAI